MKTLPLVPRSRRATPTDGLQGRDLAMALARIECAKAAPRPCQVYLAVHMVEERFKIGVSENPVARFELLPDAGQIDLSVSMVRRFTSRERANQVEKALHRALAHEQMHDLQGDGRTEWFHRRALGAAQLILSSISDAGEAHLPGRRQRSLAPTTRVLRATATNIQKASDAINLWREAGKRYPLQIRIDRQEQADPDFQGLWCGQGQSVSPDPADALDRRGSQLCIAVAETGTEAALPGQVGELRRRSAGRPEH